MTTVTKYWLLFLLAALILPVGCEPQPAPTPAPTATYSLPELKYRLISNFGGAFYCDPDFYPVGREGQEEKGALEQFSAIRASGTEFTAILKQLGLADKSDYTLEEKVRIYREHKKLTYAVPVTGSGGTLQFTLRVGEGRGERIDGTIKTTGEITVLKREPSFNTCPICLAEGILIDTPDGPIPVEQLHKGMSVWTLDDQGNRVMAVVVETVATPVLPSHQVVRVTLGDGRTVTASPGHPTATGRPLGDYRVGDTLDGAPVVGNEPVAYPGYATYDLLPSGKTGLYWANGVLLKSTIRP